MWKEYRDAFVEMAEQHKWIDPFAVTLTAKSANWRSHSQNFRHFLNRLNCSVLGNAFKRHGRRVSILAAQEGAARDHPHYHCVIDNPFPDQKFRFIQSIKMSWLRTELGLPEMNIKPIENLGWFKYMAKGRDKSVYYDSFDWENSWLENQC